MRLPRPYVSAQFKLHQSSIAHERSDIYFHNSISFSSAGNERRGGLGPMHNLLRLIKQLVKSNTTQPGVAVNFFRP